MSRFAFLIDRETNTDGVRSYVVLDPGSKSGQALLDHGMIVPCQMTREEAERKCGVERVAAFDRMVDRALLGTGSDYRLTRYPRP